MSSISRKPCRCLLREMDDQKEFWAVVRDRLDSMPAEQCTENGVYRERLKSCRKCTHLVNGFCALCGCVVELRAARQLMGCPDSPPRWNGSPTSAG